MGPQTGHVYALDINPGRPEAIRVEFGNRPHSYETYSALFSVEDGAAVTVDGKPVTAGELFAWLLAADAVTVTVHPCPQRYGVSLKTEFKKQVIPVPA